MTKLSDIHIARSNVLNSEIDEISNVVDVSNAADFKLFCILRKQLELIHLLYDHMIAEEESSISDHEMHYAFLIDKFNIAKKALETIQIMQISDYDGMTSRQVARQALIDIDKIDKLEVGKVSRVLSND
jgi:hypothetical protein